MIFELGDEAHHERNIAAQSLRFVVLARRRDPRIEGGRNQLLLVVDGGLQVGEKVAQAAVRVALEDLGQTAEVAVEAFRLQHLHQLLDVGLGPFFRVFRLAVGRTFLALGAQ